MVLSKSLEEETDKSIDKIIYGLLYHTEEEIFRENYDLASESLDSLLYWKDIRGNVTNREGEYIKIDERVNNIIIKIIDYNFKDD